MVRLCVVSVLLYPTLCSAFLVSTKAGCSIDLTKLNPESIVVSSSKLEFLYPEPAADTVFLSPSANAIISCPGSQLSVGSITIGQSVNATCHSGATFVINGQNIDLDEIVCTGNPKHTARYTGNPCGNGDSEIEIGFLLDSYRFARQITVCFDESTKTTLYSAYNLTRSIGHRETGVPRPRFTEDDFYNLGTKVNDLYSRNGQKATINSLVGLSVDSTKYIQDSSDYYLARGHLAAKADFVYAPQQQATFHYCNAAPQWQTLNGKNWAAVEMDVRDYAEDKGVDLIIYTGTYGVATLPHEQTGEDVPLHLYVDSNGNVALPVPELFWKVVYDPNATLGVALLGLNNPYQKDLGKSLVCSDVSSSIKWLRWKATNQKSGYSYACAVDDFRRSISFLPNFPTTGLLI